MSKKSKAALNRSTNKNMYQIVMILCLCSILAIVNILYTMISHKHLWSNHDVLNTAIADGIGTQILEGKRGTIYDRNHMVLAQETPAYTMIALFDNRTADEIAQEEAKQQQSDSRALSAAATEGTYDEVKAQLDKEAKERSLQYVTDPQVTASKIASILGDSVDKQTLTDILKSAMERGASQTELGTGTKRLDKSVMETLQAAEIPGIAFLETTKRNYPSTPFSSNLLGFASYSEDSQSISGVMGLERTLDTYLSGKDGEITYQQSSIGQIIPGTTTVLAQSQPGDDVVLTLDSNLQQIVEQQMQVTMESNNAEAAWCVVMEVETGKILAWASYPTYDQNTHLEIPSYTDNVTEMAYEPGSVMKPFVYAAAIDSGVYPYNTDYRAGMFSYTYDSDTGKILRLENGAATPYPAIQDANGNDFGTLSFEDGLAHSSNIAICELLANYLDKKTFEKYLESFHFFEPTDIRYVNEVTGTMNIDDPTSYLSTGFGQASSISVLQLCQAYTALFNDGVMMQPYVVDTIIDSATGEIIEKAEPTVVGTPISASTANQVKDILSMVVQPGYSGEKFAMDGVDLVAKTGTGERYNVETGTYDTVNYTSSIMAAAPYDDPKIMVYWGMVSSNYINYSPVPFQTIMQQALIANSVNGGSSSSSTENYDGWESYTMPNLINHSVDYAAWQMEEKKVNTVFIGDGSNVVDQFPKAGTIINSNDNIIVLTDGDALTMPDLIGWTRKDLTAFWQLTGLAVECDGYGKVVWQSVEAGTPIAADTAISVSLE